MMLRTYSSREKLSRAHFSTMKVTVLAIVPRWVEVEYVFTRRRADKFAKLRDIRAFHDKHSARNRFMTGDYGHSGRFPSKATTVLQNPEDRNSLVVVLPAHKIDRFNRNGLMESLDMTTMYEYEGGAFDDRRMADNVIVSVVVEQAERYLMHVLRRAANMDAGPEMNHPLCFVRSCVTRSVRESDAAHPTNDTKDVVIHCV